jgi:hypothetical protein
MTEELHGGHNQSPQAEFIARITEHARLVAEMTQDGGVLATVAGLKLANNPELAEQYKQQYGDEPYSPDAIYKAVLAKPEKGKSLNPRWQLVEELKKVTEAGEWQADIRVAAMATGMCRKGGHEDYSAIDPQKAVFVVEGGANKTSVVRRGVAEKALHVLYGEDISDHRVYQLGGNRVIEPVRADGSPNPEHDIVRKLIGDTLPKDEAVQKLVGDFSPDDSFTEFQANLATALVDGYTVVSVAGPRPEVGQTVTLAHADTKRPRLVQVQPTGVGLEGGFNAVAALEVPLDRQFVIATNGQYRPKDMLQAAAWVTKNDIPMTPAVAIGDETDEKFRFRQGDIVTPGRPPAAYINELALYGRQTAESLAPKTLLSLEREDPSGYRFVDEPDGSSWMSYSPTDNLLFSGPNDPGMHPE